MVWLTACLLHSGALQGLSTHQSKQLMQQSHLLLAAAQETKSEPQNEPFCSWINMAELVPWLPKR